MHDGINYKSRRKKLVKYDDELEILKSLTKKTSSFLVLKKVSVVFLLLLSLIYALLCKGIIVPCYNVYHNGVLVGKSQETSAFENVKIFPALSFGGISENEEIFENILLSDNLHEKAFALKVDDEILFTAESEQIILAHLYAFLKNKNGDIKSSFENNILIEHGVFEKNLKRSSEEIKKVLEENLKVLGYEEVSEEKLFSAPVIAPISSPFGERWGREHKGVDFAANHGDDVLASSDGKVIFSGFEESFGNLIIIEHENGFESYYAHMSERISFEGDFVSKGQVIGKVGSTGKSTGPHLHFEIRKYNEAQNPLEFIE